MRLAVLVIAAMVAGCATQDRIVQVPVIVPCLGPAVDQPDYQYGIGAYPGEVIAAKLMASDLIAAKQHAVDLQARMAGCR